MLASTIYYDLQPKGTLFQPRAYIYTFKKLSDIPEDRFPMTQRAEGV